MQDAASTHPDGLKEELTQESFRKKLSELLLKYQFNSRNAYTDYHDEVGEEKEQLHGERVDNMNKFSEAILQLCSDAMDKFGEKEALLIMRGILQENYTVFLEKLLTQERIKNNGNEESTETSTMSPDMLTTSGIQRLVQDGATIQIRPSEVEGKVDMDIKRA